MGAHASAKHPSSETSSAGTRTGVGPSSLAECFLCQAWAVLLDSCTCTGSSILSEVRPPTGEPDAGDPPVRFGGRGNPLRFSLPLFRVFERMPVANVVADFEAFPVNERHRWRFRVRHGQKRRVDRTAGGHRTGDDKLDELTA